MDSSPSDTPHRSRPRRWNVAADMPGFASGAPWRGRAGRGAYGCMALPRVAFWCASESFFVLFRRVCRAARGASLPLLGGCAAERGAAGSSAVWLWAALLVAGIVAFGVLSRRLRNENAEEPSAFGFLPDVLRWSNICSRFRGVPPAEEQPPLTPFSSDLALIDEILLQACDRDAEILLSPAPVTPAAGGEADAGFDAPFFLFPHSPENWKAHCPILFRSRSFCTEPVFRVMCHALCSGQTTLLMSAHGSSGPGARCWRGLHSAGATAFAPRNGFFCLPAGYGEGIRGMMKR